MINQFLDQQDEYAEIARKMEKLGLDPESEEDYERYLQELEDDEPNY
jgi:hypothetical protein